MSYPYHLPLFQPGHDQGSWNERMQPGEFAVHYSSFRESDGTTPYCTVFGSLPEAVAYAQAEVAEMPALRCTIYDHQGMVGAPLRDVRGSEYKDRDISPRFRRWVGSILFIGGIVLTIVDWFYNFELLWPAMIGVRMIIPGMLLLFIEAMVVLNAKMRKHRLARGKTA